MRASRLGPQMARLVAAEPALQIHVREAARRLHASPAAMGVVLRSMEQSGVLTSRWVGRSRVYSVAVPTGVKRTRRQVGARFPVAPGEWELRPYFLWDRDLSWREFREIAIDPAAPRSDWAVARLLDHARWADIWNLVSPEVVRRVLPRVRVKHQDVWRDLVNSGHAAG